MIRDIYKIMAMLLFCLFTLTSYGQGLTISGVVKDQDTGETIPGATVLVKGTTNGSVTDIEGRYSLTVNGKGGEVLMVSFIGYIASEIPVNGRSVVDANLQVDIAELEEVVVIGYGTQKKKVVTGAIASVSSKEITSTPVLRVEQAMQGRMAGVQVTNLSGQPGEAPSVVIRGIGTQEEGAAPIYVVDGMVVGGIDYLNPGDIESIDVLKDAASSAIYGARAANGVVLITTKSGEKGRVSMTYSGYYGIQNAAKQIDMLGAEDYMMMQNEGARNGGLDEPFDLNQVPVHDTNWQDELFTDNAPMSNHELQVTGGSEKSTFSSSISVFSQEGIVGGDKSQYDRVTARFNSRHQVTDWFRFGNNIAYANKKRRSIDSNTSFNGALSSALNLDPLTPVTEQDADILGAAPYSTQPVIYADNGYPYGISTLLSSEIVNPLALIENQKEKSKEDKLVGGVYAEVEPIKGLVIKTQYSIDMAYQWTNNYTPLYYLNGSQGNLERTNVSTQSERWYNWQWDNTVTYSKRIQEHNFTALLGTSSREERFENVGGSNDKVEIIDPENIYIDQALDTTENAYGRATEYAIYSYFGRLLYDYKDKYSLTLVWRRDYSSRFGENSKYADFPSIGLAWVVSDESFMQGIRPLNLLKLRTSYGENGNDNIPNSKYYATMNLNQGYTFGSGYAVGMSPANAFNADLRWETGIQYNVALDFGLFDNKLTGTAEWYNKITKDLLFNPALFSHSGVDAPWVNLGEMSNQGIELSMNYRGALGDLKYSIGGNVSYNKNELTRINGVDDVFIPGSSWSVAGEVSRSTAGNPVSYFYGYQTDGIFQNEAEVFQHIGPTGSPLQPSAVPGDVRFVDVDNNGVINDLDKTQIGSPVATWTYGFNGSLDFKGFDFSFLFVGVHDVDIFAGYQRKDLRYINLPASSLDRWTVENPSDTDPRFTWTDSNNNARVSDLYIEDGSFLRLKNLQLGYTIPSSVLDKIGATNWRFYVSGENLLTFTKYSGFDPEIGASNPFAMGIDSGIYPQARTFRLGTSLSF